MRVQAQNFPCFRKTFGPSSPTLERGHGPGGPSGAGGAGGGAAPGRRAAGGGGCGSAGGGSGGGGGGSNEKQIVFETTATIFGDPLQWEPTLAWPRGIKGVEFWLEGIVQRYWLAPSPGPIPPKGRQKELALNNSGLKVLVRLL